jgi:hypothetical protein
MSESGRGWARGLVRGFGLATGIGLNFAVLVTCGALAGRFFDKTRDGSLFTVLGVALGAAAALVNMLRILAWFQRQAERDETE